MKKHIIVGFTAGILLFMIYGGILTLAESFSHALTQTAELWYWILALTVGFGVQAGLYSFIRQARRQRGTPGTAGVAVSGGVSAGSMAACCAHHLADVLPLLGLSGLAAFLTDYQTLFLVIGVLSNLVGISLMLEIIQRNNLSYKLTYLRLNMKLVRKGALTFAVVATGATALQQFLIT